MEIVNWNGNLVKNLVVPSHSRALRYADAVYDNIKYVAGNIIFWEDHYFRLMANMRIIRMQIPDSFTMEYIEQQIKRTIIANLLENQAVWVRFLVVRTQGKSLSPESNAVEYLIEVQPADNPFYQNKNIPYTIEIFKDFYIQADLLSSLKTTNKMQHIVGSVFCKENDYQNCILLNHHKNVVSALNGNLFLVQNGVVKTPSLSQGCINGITRKKILEILRKTNEFQVEETEISPFELQKSDEIFITNTKIGIQSVSQYRKKQFTNTLATNLVGKLNTLARMQNQSL